MNYLEPYILLMKPHNDFIFDYPNKKIAEERKEWYSKQTGKRFFIVCIDRMKHTLR